MRVEIIHTPTPDEWLRARNAQLASHAQTTANAPGSHIRLKMIMSEHSPIRWLAVEWAWYDLPYWVSVHLTRHNLGITHVVSSQRPEVQKEYDRRKAPQDAPVTHNCVANFQAIMNISQARTCYTAAAETRQAWQMMLDALKDHEPELVSLCGPHCLVRGGICPEVYSACRYNTSDQFYSRLDYYRGMFEEAKR